MILFPKNSFHPPFEAAIGALGTVSVAAVIHPPRLSVQDEGSLPGGGSVAQTISWQAMPKEDFARAKASPGKRIRVKAREGVTYDILHYARFGFLIAIKTPSSGMIEVTDREGLKMRYGTFFLREGDAVKLPSMAPYRFQIASSAPASFVGNDRVVKSSMPFDFVELLAKAFLEKGTLVSGAIFGMPVSVKFDAHSQMFAFPPPASRIRMAALLGADQALFDRASRFRYAVRDAVFQFGSSRPFLFDSLAVDAHAKKLKGPKPSLSSKIIRRILARDTPSHYQILGLTKEGLKSHSQLKRAYYKASREAHPDLHPENPNARDVFEDVQKAYEAICEARGWKS